MSLVAYEASSDESDYEYSEDSKAIVTSTLINQTSKSPATDTFLSGNISDEEDDFLLELKHDEKDFIKNFSKRLPKPKNYKNLFEQTEKVEKPTFITLPTPKSVDTQFDIEDDDEFLHKKPSEQIIENYSKCSEIKKNPVKITIPSLKNFKDVEKEIADKARNANPLTRCSSSGISGLLSILPKAKSEQNFAKVSDTSNHNGTLNAVNNTNPAVPSFIPDSVKHKRPAANTEDLERLKPARNKLQNQAVKEPAKMNLKTVDSDDSDDDNTGAGDFFSFNTSQKLPEVSTLEINELVAKKAAKIAETSAKYLVAKDSQKSCNIQEIQEDSELEFHRKRYHQEQQLNSEALQVLVGGNTKRRRHQSDIQVIDINSSQVMPNKDEWMRTALASSTTYQPTGVLVDEEPASGTRRKHQITYLAHKAKANEAELQAMWAANRQNRRATQSKYGF